MSKEAKSGSAKETTKPTVEKASSTEGQMEMETRQGFRGTEVDPTPNENYTVAGVISGAPTPETDAAHAESVRRATGLGLSPLEAAEREKTARGEK